MTEAEQKSTMWKTPTKKLITNNDIHSYRRDDVDYVKAAAWAWYLRGAGIQSKPVEEDYHGQSRNSPIKRGNKKRPSRFKLEALGLLSNNILENSFTTLDTLTGMVSDSGKGFRDYLDFFSLECRNDVCGSSLFDSYDLVALSKQVEDLICSITEHSVSCEKSACKNSWMDHGISAELCNNKRSKVRIPESPVLCSSSARVVIPGYVESGQESGKGKKNHHNHHWRLYDLAKKLHVLGFGFHSGSHK